MKKILLAVSLLSSVSLLSYASVQQQCDTSPQQLGAIYKFEQSTPSSVRGSLKGLAEGSTNGYEMQLWRSHDSVIQVRTQPAITNKWHKTVKGRQRLVQYFDNYQRGIEYETQQPNEQRWQDHNQLISDQLLAQLAVTEMTGRGCLQEVKYQGTIGNEQYQVTWLPQLKLLKSYQQSNSKQRLTIELTSLVKDEHRISQQFNHYQDYQLIDFADIGDNESDPFWAKMINMGYVNDSAGGFYQADGSAIAAGHSH